MLNLRLSGAASLAYCILGDNLAKGVAMFRKKVFGVLTCPVARNLELPKRAPATKGLDPGTHARERPELCQCLGEPPPRTLICLA